MKRLLQTLLIALCLCMLAACSDSPFAKHQGTITIAHTVWESDIASSQAIKVALEKAGYDVILQEMGIADAWQAVASGKADAMLGAWLPDTQRDYYKKHQSNIDDLGPNYSGTRTGLVVPKYVSVLTIEELNSYYRHFDGKIYGIEKSAGITSETKKAIRLYDIAYTLLEGAEKTVLSDLNNAIITDEWIVITGWKPHWIFSKWHLKFLDDPEHAYGKEGTINTIARKGLKQEHPDAWQVLKNFYWDNDEIQSLMLINHQHPATLMQNTKQWIDDHPSLLKKWLRKVDE